MYIYKFGCELEIRSSHEVNKIEFSGCSSYILDEDVIISCPFGIEKTDIKLNKTNSDGKIKISVESSTICSKEEQAKYLEKIAHLLSSVLGFKEKNAYYGTPFITLKLETFLSTCDKTITCEPQGNGEYTYSDNIGVQMSDSLSIESITHVKFSDFDFSQVNDNEFISHYHNGLKAESSKSKFFHLFLVLEILEGCELYSRMFPAGSMFTDIEEEKIRNLANEFSGPKKSLLLSSLNRTAKFRNEKLFDLISELGIYKVSSVAGERDVDYEMIKRITDTRNKLFHKSESFDDGVLYYSLFPLVTQIVELIVKDPTRIL
ncbi:hypothetical protein AB6D73_00980 [Vibrio splendidus]